MPRHLSLHPKFIAGRPQPWMLRIPPYLSDTGKVKRQFYRTKREAQTAADLVRTRADNFGRSLRLLTPAQIGIAAKAFEMIGERPEVALLEIIQVWLAAEQKRAASVPWSVLMDEFLATKETRSLKHRTNLGHTEKRFASLGPRIAAEITTEELAEKLPVSLSSRNLEIRHLRSIFTYGKKRGWLSESPADTLDVAELGRREVECFTADQVRALFNYTLEKDLDLIPYFAFGFFCGVRPEGELLKLEWSNLHLEGPSPELEIPAHISKTKRRRFVELNETVLAWINAYQERGGPSSGRLIPFAAHVIDIKRREAAKATHVKWIQQGMRHSFCSAWLAKHRDINKLVLMSGHDNVDTMWRHYHRGMSEKEAARYWAILPPSTDVSKVVPFHAGA